jgi:dihydroorotase
MRYELLLKGGTLIDPDQGIHGVRDVGLAAGRVLEVGADLPVTLAREVVDCSGRIVAPGMIDLHVHVYPGVSHYGIEPDPHCLARGVTTAVDAGSAGADTFIGFRKYVLDVSATRLYAHLNIATLGMVSPRIGELDDLRYADVSRAVAMVEQHRDVILGIKVRLTAHSIVSEAAGLRPLYLAREAADATGLPIMVHPNGAWADSLDEILAVLQEGDMVTHCFHGKGCGVLDEQGGVRRAVYAARERGVRFDVGHGQGSFKWGVAERALQQGFLPDTISSDLHIYDVDGPVYDLATTVTKFVHLGLSLDDALARVTAAPAQVLRMADEIGTLKPGAWGDVVVFEHRQERCELLDAEGERRMGTQRLVPVMVVRGGRTVGCG